MIIDSSNPEDIEDHPLDHAPDALRYGLMSRPAPAKPLPKLKDISAEARVRRNIERQSKPKKGMVSV
ncbi:hypothetical protein D3C86_1793810 [compost metagenome]